MSSREKDQPRKNAALCSVHAALEMCELVFPLPGGTGKIGIVNLSCGASTAIVEDFNIATTLPFPSTSSD